MVVAMLGAAVLTSLLAVLLLPSHAAPVGAPGPALRAGSQDVAGSSYAFWGTDHRGDPLRWDPCVPIEFVVNLTRAPTEAERDLRTALMVLAEASGMRLDLIGRTEEAPAVDRPLVSATERGWRWRPVLVAWARPGEGGLPLGPFDRGIALPVAVRAGDREAFVTGQVVLNADRGDLVPGFDDRSSAQGATLIHELAHLLGLAHVDDAEQIMSVDPGSGPVMLGAGDLTGLRLLGGAAGCNPAPAAAAGRGLVVGG